MNDPSNGMMTKIWGNPGWIFNHAITFGYPLKPTAQQKQFYRQYFELLGHVLPCSHCRDSYQQFIREGDTKLTDDVLSSRENITRWFYNVHNKVNEKLGLHYVITYDDMVKQYESYRAQCGKPVSKATGCIVPLNYKAYSFQVLHHVEAPVIPLSLAKQFVAYAESLQLHNFHFMYIDYWLNQGKNDITDQELKCDKSWKDRNTICKHIRQYMVEYSIPALNENGYPTECELYLILFLSTTLNIQELEKVARHLNNRS